MEILALYLVLAAGAFAVIQIFRRRGPQTSAAPGEPPALPDVSDLNDPREAAAILLYQVAAAGGDLSDAQDEALLEGMRALFGGDQSEIEDLFAFAWRALGENNDPRADAAQLVRPIVRRCTEAERRELATLMRRIAAVEGPANDAQLHLISQAEDALLATQ